MHAKGLALSLSPVGSRINICFLLDITGPYGGPSATAVITFTFNTITVQFDKSSHWPAWIFGASRQLWPSRCVHTKVATVSRDITFKYVAEVVVMTRKWPWTGRGSGQCLEGLFRVLLGTS